MRTQPRSDSLPVGKTRALFRLVARCGWLPAALVALAVLSFTVIPAPGAVTEAWVQRYSNDLNNSQDGAFKVVRDAAGDIMVVGTTRDDLTTPGMVIIKYSGADGSVLWQKRYAVLKENANDAIMAAAVDGHGNLVVTGFSFGDYYTAKYAGADGAALWARGYNGPGNSIDIPWSLAVDADGNVVVTGSSKNGIDNLEEDILYDSDYYTVKYAAADGALLWEKRYTGPANGNDYARSVAVDASGNVVVTGFSFDAIWGSDLYTAKYARADGALIWEKRYHASALFYALESAVAVDAGGNVVVTGSSFGGASALDYYTARYAAADGALLWEKRYNGPANVDDRIRALAVDGSGNVVVTGVADDYGRGSNFYTAKYAAADGALLWEQHYDGPGNSYDQPFALAVEASGSVVVTGYSAGGANGNHYTAKYAAANGALVWEKRSSHVLHDVTMYAGGDVVATGGFSNDFYTARYAAADGALLWEKRYNGPSDHPDQARAVAVDASGNVIVTGESATAFNTFDYYTAKYAAADGALLWEKRYDGPVNSDDKARAVAVDPSGNVVVTGSSYNTTQDFYTAKYASANGALLWEKRGPGGNPSAVAVDGSGNVAVTGISSDESGTDFYTAKYAAVDGALLWEKRYKATVGNVPPAAAMAVDGSGNVVIAGTIDGVGAFNCTGDFYTAKYAATDGALLWEKRYSGPTAYSEEQVTAVAVDGSGNVVVTGSSGSDDIGSAPDYYTAKFAAADGALLWEKRYDGPANDADVANAVAVDAGGNVVVTGSSQSITAAFGHTTDYYTAKYAAGNGALLWEKRYKGPGDSDDFARAVAVDASGNVVVTGESRGECYSAKYAAADGALLWERRFSGLVADGSRSLALGPNGTVAITGASGGDYTTVVFREIPGPASFAAWAAGFGLSGGDAAASADPDGDGVVNAAEYILGGNPTSPATPQPPTVAVSGGNMLLTFPRDDTSETPDVTVTVETSTDLANWPGVWPTVFFIGSSAVLSYPGVTIAENGDAADTVTVAVPVGTDKAKFARLRTTITP